MSTIALAAVIVAAVAGRPQLPAAVRANQCAECHLQVVWTRSELTHTDEWVTSKHARYGVGCDKCHGGDAATTDRTAAHRGVTAAGDPSSPVHWMQLPATCGGCHAAEGNAFARSIHSELLRQGDAMVPTCTTCHSSMSADVPSALDVERRCASCHPPDRDDRARRARRDLDEIAGLQKLLRRARLEVAAIADARRQQELAAERDELDVAIRATVAATHGFDRSRVDARLGEARAVAEHLARAFAR